MDRYLVIFIFMAAVCFTQACNERPEEQTAGEEKKIGVLMVNHGSRSETWRNALLALEANIRKPVLESGKIQGIKTAFMEYNEPSIATRLKEFDKEGYTDVIIVPVFLTVSPHSFDDIPTIIGRKEDPRSMELLKIERIERYTPAAEMHITPLLDFTDILQRNVLRRFRELSADAAKEGLVMIAYGDETYTREWSELLSKVGDYVNRNTGTTDYSFGWCGHVAGYNPDSTSAAVNRVLMKKESAVVIPVLVAVDESFQMGIISTGISRSGNEKKKVLYRPDAILPDTNLESWVIHTIGAYAGAILGESGKTF